MISGLSIASTFVYTPFEEVKTKTEPEIYSEALSSQAAMRYGKQNSEIGKLGTKKISGFQT